MEKEFRRTLVLGDIHGAHKALLQVLERSQFDKEEDRLIFLGDVVDGWTETKQCIEELLTIKNLVSIIGNHDDWFLQYLITGRVDPMWVSQGGRATIESYGADVLGDDWNPVIHGIYVPDSHKEYLKNAKLWFQEDNRIFVHGGWEWHNIPHPSGDPEGCFWDRQLWNSAYSEAKYGRESPLTMFEEVYIGHTTTTRYGSTLPMTCCGVTNMDTGAGWEGKLSIMDIDTKDTWQSDVVSDLYPESKGRRG